MKVWKNLHALPTLCAAIISCNNDRGTDSRSEAPASPQAAEEQPSGEPESDASLGLTEYQQREKSWRNIAMDAVGQVLFQNKHICSGTLVGPQTVLTAATCVSFTPSSNPPKGNPVGPNSLTFVVAGVTYNVIAVIRHPQFVPSNRLTAPAGTEAVPSKNDLALLTLKTPNHAIHYFEHFNLDTMGSDGRMTNNASKYFRESRDFYWVQFGKNELNPTGKRRIGQVGDDYAKQSLGFVSGTSVDRAEDLISTKNVPCAGDMGSPIFVNNQIAGIITDTYETGTKRWNPPCTKVNRVFYAKPAQWINDARYLLDGRITKYLEVRMVDSMSIRIPEIVPNKHAASACMPMQLTALNSAKQPSLGASPKLKIDKQIQEANVSITSEGFFWDKNCTNSMHVLPNFPGDVTVRFPGIGLGKSGATIYFKGYVSYRSQLNVNRQYPIFQDSPMWDFSGDQRTQRSKDTVAQAGFNFKYIDGTIPPTPLPKASPTTPEVYATPSMPAGAECGDWCTESGWQSHNGRNSDASAYSIAARFCADTCGVINNPWDYCSYTCKEGAVYRMYRGATLPEGAAGYWFRECTECGYDLGRNPWFFGISVNQPPTPVPTNQPTPTPVATPVPTTCPTMPEGPIEGKPGCEITRQDVAAGFCPTYYEKCDPKQPNNCPAPPTLDSDQSKRGCHFEVKQQGSGCPTYELICPLF